MQDFTRHIKEAIQLNTVRRPLYAQLTNNASIPFSNKLINYERLILVTAGVVDLIGDRFQKKGIPFIKEEFIDIDLSSDFAEAFPQNIDYSSPIIIYPFEETQKKMQDAFKSKDHSELFSLCKIVLEDLKLQTHVYCMTRHLLESMRRVAYLIPFHEQKSEKIGVKPPTFYAWILIRSHFNFLKQSIDFDEKVAFIQESGIPFIWQDLPSIDLITCYSVENISPNG